MVFPCLAFLNLSNSGTEVLSWFVNLITAAQIIDYIVICITYIFFYRACRAQGLDRKTLPYCGIFQPYSAWIGLVFLTAVVFTYGYSVFLPGKWAVKTFFTYYMMVLICPVFYFGWKLVHKTRAVRPEEADLQWIAPMIDAYEATHDEVNLGFWTEIMQIFGMRKKKVVTESESS